MNQIYTPNGYIPISELGDKQTVSPFDKTLFCTRYCKPAVESKSLSCLKLQFASPKLTDSIEVPADGSWLVLNEKEEWVVLNADTKSFVVYDHKTFNRYLAKVTSCETVETELHLPKYSENVTFVINGVIIKNAS